MAAHPALPGTICAYLDYRPVDEITARKIVDFSLILAVLFSLDILSTQLILWLGGIELNPLMVGIVASPLLHLALKAGILLLIITVSLIAEKKVRGSAVIFNCILVTLYLFVIVNNAFVLIPRVAVL